MSNNNSGLQSRPACARRLVYGYAKACTTAESDGRSIYCSRETRRISEPNFTASDRLRRRWQYVVVAVAAADGRQDREVVHAR